MSHFNYPNYSPFLVTSVLVFDTIDTEDQEIRYVVSGFVGNINGSCGLIRYGSSEERIDIVIDEIKKCGVSISDKDLQELKDKRL